MVSLQRTGLRVPQLPKVEGKGVAVSHLKLSEGYPFLQTARASQRTASSHVVPSSYPSDHINSVVSAFHDLLQSHRLSSKAVFNMFLIFIFSLPGSYFYLPSWSYCAENTPDSFQLLCISAYLCLSTCPLPGQKTKHFPGQGFSHRPHVDHPPLNSYRVSFLACGSGLATVYSMKLSHNKVPMGIPQGEKTWWAQ